MSLNDISRLTQPRDDLLLHGEMAVRAGRELCRWATNSKQNNDRYLAQRLAETQQTETTLRAQLSQLTERVAQLSESLLETCVCAGGGGRVG